MDPIGATATNEWAKDKPLSILQLDPADRAVLRIADERDAIQKKTFTKWANKHLKKAGRHINDLFEDLRDGHNLISLLEVLSGELLPRERGKLRFHMLQNVQVALDFLKFRKIKLVNIRAEDIVDGNPKLTLGLIWTIILLFQISDIIHHGDNVDISAKEALLQWSRRMTDKYPGVRVRDFTSSWRDGLAFNAILHRNRPDLIDFRNLRKRSARDNLDSAFNIAEREFNVTRLLDAEDVDTLQPDEKSLITYISSLYDVFPEPPPMPPLVDRETLKKIDTYRDLAASLYVWIRDNTQKLQDRSFPNTLIELKSLLTECNRFRVDDVPHKLKQKQRVVQLYREIVKSLQEDDVFELDDELKCDSIERDWNRLINVLQERDKAISDEMARLERLQRLAERVHREAKQCETRLDDIEKKIEEEERRIDRLHPMDAKKNCDRIEQELKLSEDVIKSMFNDVQVLKDGKYHQAPELARRVQKLHDRWSSLHINFQSRLLSKLSSRSFTTEEKKVTSERRTVLETRLVDTNEAFAFLQECLTWVANKLKFMEEADFGNDLPSIQSHLQQHQDEHKLVDQFQRNIDQCIAQKNKFSGEESTLYTQMLHKVQKTYSELLVISNKRLSDLETLLEFIKSATDELIWLNEKEEAELARDWSSKNLNVLEVEQYYETLMQDLERREPRFNRVVENGENLILQGHSASKCVEAYLAAMRTQWSWVLQLTVCLETHIKYASSYHQFFREASECEHWLDRQEERLSGVFSRTDFSLDDGERLLRDMQDLKNDLNRYGEIVANLGVRSKEIVPLKSRHRPVTRPTKITSICSYKQLSMNINKGDKCTLHDNSQKIKWKVTTKTGLEGHVPAVCFILPPPNQEAIQTAEKLKRLLERILALWAKRQRRMRQNMIFATIKVVRSWDLQQFLAMEPSQREAIWKALNDDANKLIQEGPSDDPGLRRLKEEMKKCNDQFADLQKKALAMKSQKAVSPTRELSAQYLSTLEVKLNDAGRTLEMRCQSPVPKDTDAVESLVIQHKAFETDLVQLEPQIVTVESSLKASPRKASQTNARCEAILHKWRDIWVISNAYIERLKFVEIALGHLDDVNGAIAELELKLASYDNLPSNQSQLKQIHESLLELQPALHRHQPAIDRLNDTVSKLRSAVDRSRPGKARHSDVDKLESDVQKLNIRWSNVGTQIVERLRSCEASSELLNLYKSSHSTEKLFLSQIEVKLDNLKPVRNLSPKQVLTEVETGMGIYHSLSGQQSNMEQVNTEGGRYVREAKIYDMRVKHYRESLEDVHPSLDASLSKKKAKVQPVGAEVIAAEVNALNEHYTTLINRVLQRLHQLLDVAPKEHISKIRIIIQEAVPLSVRTFHKEFSLVPTDVIDGAELLESYGESRRTTTYSSSRTVQHSVFTSAEDMDITDKADNRTSTASLTLTFKEEPALVTQHKVKTIVDHRHSRSKDRTEIVEEIRDTSPVQGASMTFTELRSSRKVEQVEEGIGTEPWWRLKGVKNLKTDNWVTLADGIRSNIILVPSTEYVDLRNNKRMSISEAVARGYVDAALWDKLQQLCGIIDPKTGRELTLWEAIQRGLFDPERGCFIDPRTGRPLTAEEAMKLGLLLQEKCSHKDVGTSLTDAVRRGLISPTSGQFIDHDTGKKFNLDEAVARRLLSGSLTEIVDTRTYDRLTVDSALETGVIDPINGRFINMHTKETLTLDRAVDQRLLAKPITLKEAHELGCLKDNGDVTDPLTGTVYPFLVAIGKGFLDMDVRAIFSPESRELLTIPEALSKGLIVPQGLYCNPLNGDLIPFSEAVQNGWVSSVTQKRIFDVEGFQDVVAGDYVTFNVAVSKGLIRLSTGEVHDVKAKEYVTLREAVSRELVQPQVAEMFAQKIGISDETSTELSLWDATWKRFVSHQTGDILDRVTRLPVPLVNAVERELITPEGAALLRSFLNITVSVATVTTHVIKNIVVTTDVRYTWEDAERTGLIDTVNGTFTHPGTGAVVSIEDALNTGLLSSNTDWPVHPSPTDLITTTTSMSVTTCNGQTPNENLSPTTENVTLQKSILTSTTSRVIGSEAPSSPTKKSGSSSPPSKSPERQTSSKDRPSPKDVFKKSPERRTSPPSKPRTKTSPERIVTETAPVKRAKSPDKLVSEKKAVPPVGQNRKPIDNKTRQKSPENILIGPAPKSPTKSENPTLKPVPVSKITSKDDRKPKSPVKEDDLDKSLARISDETTVLVSVEHDVPDADAVRITSDCTVKVSFEDDRPNLWAAIERGQIDRSVVTVLDSVKCEYVSLDEAFERGLVDCTTGDYRPSPSEKMSLDDALKKGVLVLPATPELTWTVTQPTVSVLQKTTVETEDEMLDDAVITKTTKEVVSETSEVVTEVTEIEKMTKVTEIIEDDEDDDDRLVRPSSLNIRREPHFAVKIGRAQTIDSPEREAKLVTLHKVRRRVIGPKQAADEGLLDDETADILDDKGSRQGPCQELLTLEEAIKLKVIDGQRGAIKDSVTGSVLTIEEAIKRGLLDPATGDVIYPIARGLTLVEAVSQGLVEPDSRRIIHPETGARLTLQEAVLCEVLDSASGVLDSKTGQLVTLDEALKRGVVDRDTADVVVSKEGRLVPLFDAVKLDEIFRKPDPVKLSILAPIGLTFLVALQRGLIDDVTAEFVHPVTGQRINIEDAFRSNLLMIMPAPTTPDSRTLTDAILAGDIDVQQGTYNAGDGDVVTVQSALETGLLKSLPFEPRSTSERTSITTILRDNSPTSGVSSVSTVTITSVTTTVIDDDVEQMSVTRTSRDTSPTSDVMITTIIDGESTDKFIIPEVYSADDINMSTVSAITIETKKTATQQLALSHATTSGHYDPTSASFLDRQTGKPVPFATLATSDGPFHPEVIKVKHPVTRNLMTLNEALERHLIDDVTGEMLNAQTGCSVSFFEAVRLDWIVVDVQGGSLRTALKDGLYNQEQGTIVNQETGEIVLLHEALRRGIIDSTSFFIWNSTSESLITFRQAVDESLVDVNKGVINVPNRPTPISLNDALAGGLLVLDRQPMSLEAAVRKGLYIPSKSAIKDPDTNRLLSLEEAVRTKLVDADITEIKDNKEGRFLPLIDAQKRNLIVGLKVKDTARNDVITLDVALDRGLIATIRPTMTLVDAIRRGLYSRVTGLLTDFANGEDVTLQESIESGLIDVESVWVKDERTNTVLTLKDALRYGVVDGVKGVVTYPIELTLDDALEMGFIIRSYPPFTLQEVLDRSLYDGKTGCVIRFDDGEKETLEDAIGRGWINAESLTVRDRRSDDILTLSESIRMSIVDSKTGILIDPVGGAEMNFYDALELGLIIPSGKRLSLSEAIGKGLYNAGSGQFLNPATASDKMTLSRAITRGLIDISNVLVRNPTSSNALMSFSAAIDQGIVDAALGTLKMSPAKQVNFVVAMETGLVIEVRRPLAVRDALQKGLQDDSSGLFLDPCSGRRLTLSEAIETKLLDADSVHVKDTRTGFWKKVNLKEAVELELVEDSSGQVINVDGSRMSLRSAFESGLVLDSRREISIQKALHQGLYDENSGRFTDPNTGRKVTLHEAIRRSIIGSDLPCYWSSAEGRLLSLIETVRLGIIGRTDGRFTEPITGDVVSLLEALERGWIVDIESPFGLYEAVTMGLYDASSGRFLHPTNGRKLDLNEAVMERLIDPSKSIVRHVKTDRFMLLPEAISAKLIDSHAGVYCIPSAKVRLTLDVAVDRALVVTARRPLTLEEIVVKMRLYNKRTGEFIEPIVGDRFNLARAQEIGFLDDSTAAIQGPRRGILKSLRAAIKDDDVDPIRGTIVDPKSKKSMTFDVAFEKSVLMTVDRPVTFQHAVRRGSIDLKRGTFVDPRTLHECTLEQAVRDELIDSESAVVKDPKSGRFRTLKDAVEAGIIDMDRRALVDANTGRIRTLVILFDQGTVVFLREPLTFDAAIDKQVLDVVSGRFTDRATASNEIVTLKEALDTGLVDVDSVLLKDPVRKRLLRLDQAYAENLMQAERGTVLSTADNIFVTIGGALERGLFVTSRRPLSLLEAVEYGTYDPITGLIRDGPNTMTLQQAMDAGLVDTTTTVIKDLRTGSIMTFHEAVTERIVDTVTSWVTVVVEETIETLTLTEALRRGLLSTAEARMAVQEKYKVCDEAISKLLAWIGTVEKSLAEQSPVRETLEELRDQINNLKNIKNDLDDHQRPVSSCIDQVQTVVTRGQDVLSTDEIQQLQINCRELHRRYDTSVTQCDDVLRKLSSAFDELQKLKNDLEPFVVWLRRSEDELVDKERLLLNANKVKDSTKSMKQFVSDVIAHQADLRFITMAAHRFLDESKDYLRTLNIFRTNLPRRYPHIEPHESEVKRQVTEVTLAFQELLHKASKLGDRFSSVTDKQKQFSDAVDKARSWLTEAKEQTRRICNEPVSGEPRLLQDQLDKTKTLHMDIVTQGRLIETAKHASKSLLDALGPDASNAERDTIESTVDDLEEQYGRLVQMVSDRTQELETALVHSQGVQDGIDGLLQWLNDVENQSRVQQKPASLIRERLDEQIREHRLLQADFDGHKPSVHGVTSSAEELLRSGGNARIAKRIETKLRELTTRFEKMSERIQKRGELLDDTSVNLETFTISATRFDNWFDGIRERIEPVEMAKLSMQECAMRIDSVLKEKERKRDDFDELLRHGKALVVKKDVTDTQIIKDKIKTLEQLWKDLGDGLVDKQKQLNARSEQLSSFETLRNQVFEWLSYMETKVESLQPVALDVPFVRRQQDELKPISREYNDYSLTITKVTDLGNAYDTLTRGERPDSPRRRVVSGTPAKKGFTSPTRKSPTKVPKSPEGTRSPSPTKSGGRTSPFGFAPGAVSPTSAASSGFSSRRGSQEYVHLEELSPVQQQLSEINHRYNMLGVRLTDRQHEIERLLEELRRHLESHKTLSQFVTDKERQLPRYTIPATKEATDKQLSTVKTILEEIQANQSQLDSLKTQTNELLKRKLDAYGADDLQQLISDLVIRWNGLLRDCRDVIGFLEDAKLFHDEHDHLHGFLAQKDKMMGVLGPIASEPRLVANQKEQVEVLRDEFTSQAPHLEALNHAGELLLNRVDANSLDAREVDKKLMAVNKNWQDILSRLDDREDCLNRATGAAKNFQDGINGLQATLQRISDDFDNVSEPGASAGDVEDKLRRLNRLEEDLEDQRPVMADVESLGEQLSDILSDLASKNEIKNKLNGIEKTYNNLHKKIDNRQAELESLLREGKEFDYSCENIQRWLQDMWGTVRQELLISADWETLKQQVQDYEPIYREVSRKEHEVHMLLNKGKDAVLKLTKAIDRQALQRKLDLIKEQWEKLHKEAVDKHSKLQSCNEHCRKFHSAVNCFLPWVQLAENKLDSFEPISLLKPELEKQIKEIQLFKNDLSKHSQEYESLRSLGETLIKACDVDREIIRDELEAIKQRWDRLNDAMLERAQSLETVAKKLADFTEELRDVQHSVQRCEDWLGAHDDDSTRDPKLLDRLKPLLKDAEALRGQVAHLRGKVGDLAAAASPDSNTAHVHDQVDALEDRCNRLTEALKERCSGLESASLLLARYGDKVKGVHHDLSSLEDQLDRMGPIGRDTDICKKQIYEIKSFLDVIDQKKGEIGECDRDSKEIVSQGYTTDAKGCKAQVDGLKKQLTRLEERGHSRETDLEAILTKLQKFEDDYGDVMSNIDDVAREERSFKPVGGDVDTVRVQQKEFKKFNKDNVEPLSKKVDITNRTGQSLVQSAAPGVNTTRLESFLEKLNDRWNDLKEKINDRERRLDVALLQSGKFQEAMSGLLCWLSDTEDMVANQKPPSSDYKVVKAQLQEQKFLNKMLLDRQNSVSSLLDMGKEIAANTDGAEREAIERQIGDMVERYDALTNGAQDRMDVLEKAMKVAKEFQDKMTPLAEWLNGMERKLAAMETIPTDEMKVRRLIAEHESLHDDILDKKPSFDELADVAQTLMPLVGDDEAQALADKLQELTDRYAKLVDDSEALGHFLRSSVESLNTFTINLDDVLHWVGEMESRLNRYKVLSVFIDKLQEQLDELTDLTEEIADHQKQVDELIFSGHELMKRVSGDDAIVVKEKLDTLQHRFGDLTGKAADLLSRAHAALPLVEQFHTSHHRLGDWMLSAESQLSSIEASGLDVQEREIEHLEVEIAKHRPLVDQINLVGPQLCQISPGEGAATIEGLVSRDNRRFDAICERVQRRAERIQLSKQRSSEVIGDLDELLDWFRDAEKQLAEAEPISSDADHIRLLLKEQRALNDDINSQKGRVRDVLAAAKRLMRDTLPNEDLSALRQKVDDLKETMEGVCQASADRLNALEQALPLAEHFYDTHTDLVGWLDEAEAAATTEMDAPLVNAHQIRKQQEKNKALLHSLNEHKPLIDKLNKTGHALIKLCGDDEGVKVQEVMEGDNARFVALRDVLRERQNALEEALQMSAQFADKLDGLLSALGNTADQVNNAEPISAHPPKIQEQIVENESIVDDLDKRSPAFEAIKRAAIEVIDKAGDSRDQAVKDIKQKLDRLSNLWDNIQKATNNREKSLEDALAMAEKFWDELQNVMSALKDLQDSLNAQEPPGVEPSAIQHQQDALHELEHEIRQTEPDVEQCRRNGHDLMRLCGEPDKPEVKKHIEDLDNAWENITALYAKREENLIEAMEKAMAFHDTLQNLLEFLDSAEETFANLGPLGSDIDTVKGQINQLKDFKADVDPHMVEVEALNRQAQRLTENTSPDQATAIKEPLADVNHRWDDLLKGIVNRQRQLEHALLKLGQFQHALDELFVWITKTDKTLDELKPVFGDPQVIEVELAKLKVVINDIHAHQSSVDTLNDAGRQLIEQDRGSEDASTMQLKLNELKTRWHALQKKAADRTKELEDALKDAQAFNQDIQDLLMWLSDVDAMLSTSKPVGGLPETAKEQLLRFMEIYDELYANRPRVESVLQQGAAHLKRSNEGAAKNLQHNLKALRQKWDSVLNRASDKKIKLEIALREATEFHEALQAFVEWLTDSEKYLASLKPVSRVLPVIQKQIEEHKNFQKDIGAHRETMLNLDKKGTHLKYFSQKQDVILIKNLLISVQHRWERVVSKSAERTRQLDHGFKEAKEFHDAWTELCKWLDNSEKMLDELIGQISQDPSRIKQLLAKHKEFQRTLAGKQPTYDATVKAGRLVREKAPKTDHPVIQDMLSELKNKWNSVCSKSVDRQRKLEEGLLFSGQFKDAMLALLDWLEKVKKDLGENQPVHGDLDTVNSLVEKHKTFTEELKHRKTNMESIKKTASDLLKTASKEDAASIETQTSELTNRWDEVSRLTDIRKRRLEEALKQAEELHKAVHLLLEWLSDAEMKLRFAGPLPDDEATTRSQIEEHRRFLREMADKERDKESTISLAEEILRKCHPDAAPVIKHWITIIQSRWEEVSVWARQREQRLQCHLDALRDLSSLIDELLEYLNRTERTLLRLEDEPLPDDLRVVEELIVEHQQLMDDIGSRQKDVERVTKSKKPPPAQAAKGAVPPGKGLRDGAKSPRPTIPVAKTHTLDRKTPRTSTPMKAKAAMAPTAATKNPRIKEVADKWRSVWLLALERQRRLQEKLKHMQEVEKMKNFSWDEWRKRFLRFMKNKKSRIMDFFRKMDKDGDGKLTREEFIVGILKSGFPTTRLELNAVADMFDHGDGFIDIKEFVDALRPEREGSRPLTDSEVIEDEVQKQVMLCTCPIRFKVRQVGEGKYRFGESQKLRLVRILRSTVMVRVGGGWVALDEFLVKNDPCRAKGRTNLELREQFILATGVSQSIMPFKTKSPNSSSTASQNRSAGGGSLPTTGPITKIREKSVRSAPMGRSRGAASDGTTDHSGRSSNLSGSLLSPPGTGMGYRSGSRPSSRPPSRAGSNMSLDSVDGVPASPSAGRRTPSGSTNLQRRPSNASQSSLSGSKIPTSSRRTTPTANGGVKGEIKRFK